MQPLIEILKKTTEYFSGKEIEQPRLNAELLLAHALGCKRLDLYLQFDRPLDEPTLAPIRTMIKRRARREPLQYIMGSVPFLDATLKVDQRVLIPRPETEELVGNLISDINLPEKGRVLELGTGSGAIIISLAQAWKDKGLDFMATDIDENALATARRNASRNKVSDKISFQRSDWFDGISRSCAYDLIVSNPPYLTESEWLSASPEVRQYEPKESLVAGDNGVSDLAIILNEGYFYLSDNGTIALETGIHHHVQLSEVAQKAGYRNWRSNKDFSGRDRFFIAEKKAGNQPSRFN